MLCSLRLRHRSLAKNIIKPKTFCRRFSLKEDLFPSEESKTLQLKAFGYVAATIISSKLLLDQTAKGFHYKMNVLGEDPPAPPHYKQSFGDLIGVSFQSFDHASLRRGYQVYREVCSQCHSMKMVAFRQLVGLTHTEQQAKDLAKSTMITDGPNDEGDMYERPGKLIDYFPSPYKNDEVARAANAGSLPPDLTQIVWQREHRSDYVFSLLTGYNEPPPGVQPQEGKYWNTYFDGGFIGMSPPLQYDDMVEYEDGTPATKYQMAKDVTEFLTWTGYKRLEDRKIHGPFILGTLSVITLGIVFLKKYQFLNWRNRITYWKATPK